MLPGHAAVGTRWENAPGLRCRLAVQILAVKLTVTMALCGPLTAALKLYQRVLPAESGIYCWPSVGLDTISPRSELQSARTSSGSFDGRRLAPLAVWIRPSCLTIQGLTSSCVAAAGSVSWRPPSRIAGRRSGLASKQEMYSCPFAVTENLQVSPRLRYRRALWHL